MPYLTLFSTAFLAATLLPMQSEAVLIGWLSVQQYPAGWLIAAASIGNILGSCVNWWLGKHLERFQHRAWFPISPHHQQKAAHYYHRYGVYTLLLSWLPIIGDPLTLIAGVFREKWWRFLCLVSIAKTGRYVFLYAVYHYWT